MTPTFNKANLEVLEIIYHPYSDDDADCELLIELQSLNNEDLPFDITIKVNLYDDNGNLFYTGEEYVSEDDFMGYYTFKINLYNNSRTLYEAKSAKVYISKS